MPKVNGNEAVEIFADIVQETDDAWCLCDGSTTAWVPKSLVDYDGETFLIPEWLAKDRGLI